MYIIPTFVIKALASVFFTSRHAKILNRRNVAALALSAAVINAGYYVTEAFMLDSFTGALPAIYGNLVQSAASALLFIVIGISFDKLELKRRIFN